VPFLCLIHDSRSILETGRSGFGRVVLAALGRRKLGVTDRDSIVRPDRKLESVQGRLRLAAPGVNPGPGRAPSSGGHWTGN
jgi:hypothetical protein